MNVSLHIPDTAIPLPPGIRAAILWDRIRRFAAAAAGAGECRSVTLEEEFRALLERENATISKICFSYAGATADYADLRQDALINIWRGLKSYRGDASRRTWIYRVTVNSCLSTIRREQRHRHESLESLYDLIEGDGDEREAIMQIHRIISSLGGQERAIIMMWLDEMNYDEIADAMGLNRNTVATRIRRAKEKIINLYRKEENHESGKC